jgi:hypothetical protein
MVPTVYYVFVPPWVHARIVHPLRTRPAASRHTAMTKLRIVTLGLARATRMVHDFRFCIAVSHCPRAYRWARGGGRLVSQCRRSP